MKILFINKYLHPRGGSEVSMFETVKLLESNGHKAVYFSMKHPQNLPSPHQEYFVSNVDYGGSIMHRIEASLKLLYSFEAKRRISKLIKSENPDIAHLNNIYHQLSPSIIHSLKENRIPMLMTLHDYKMVCASYSLLSKNKTCESCRNGKYYQCFLKGCVKRSRSKSLLNTMEMYLHHKVLKSYDLIDVFISPYSHFFEDKLRQMGFKRNVVHLQNFIRLDGIEPRYDWNENSIVYFGRLSTEKGIVTLLQAVKNIRDLSLKIIGDGPIRNHLQKMIQTERIKNVHLLGYRTGDDLRTQIRNSMFAVVPSEWYEPFALTIIESFALGKPVVGSRIGGIPERVIHQETGLLFEPGNPDDLRVKIEYLKDNPHKISEMGKKARSLVKEQFDPREHYYKLMEIYQQAISHNKYEKPELQKHRRLD